MNNPIDCADEYLRKFIRRVIVCSGRSKIKGPVELIVVIGNAVVVKFICKYISWFLARSGVDLQLVNQILVTELARSQESCSQTIYVKDTLRRLN